MFQNDDTLCVNVLRSIGYDIGCGNLTIIMYATMHTHVYDDASTHIATVSIE